MKISLLENANDKQGNLSHTESVFMNHFKKTTEPKSMIFVKKFPQTYFLSSGTFIKHSVSVKF